MYHYNLNQNSKKSNNTEKKCNKRIKKIYIFLQNGHLKDIHNVT